VRGYVGDETGFDPLGFSEYFPMDYLREAELKHCRLAMLGIVGFVAVDLGARIYPLPPGWEGLTAATAHDKMVEFGALGNIALFASIFEMVSYIGVSQMLQGSGREPGDFGFDPLGFLKNKSEDQVRLMKYKELKVSFFPASTVVPSKSVFDHHMCLLSAVPLSTVTQHLLQNGRIAMMAFGGAVTQSVLNDTGFPYF
jgi:hypothetical protein